MKHDWSSGVSETLTWNTRVSTPRGGIDFAAGKTYWREEHRTPLAPIPSYTISHLEWMGITDETFYRDPQGLTRVMPYYPGVSEVEVSGTVGDIYVTKADRRGFRQGGYILFLHGDGSITVRYSIDVYDQFPSDGAIIDWGAQADVTVTAGDFMMPGVLVRRSSTLSRNWSTPQVWQGADLWEGVLDASTLSRPPLQLNQVQTWESHLVDIWQPIPGYEDDIYEVVWWGGNESSSLTIGDERHRSVGGVWVARPTHQEWVNEFTRTRTLIGREEIWSARKMLFRRQGKANPAFIPAGQSLPFRGIRTHDGLQYAAFDPEVMGHQPPNVPVIHGSTPYQAIMFKGFNGERAYAAPSIWADENNPVLPVPAGEVWLSARLVTPPAWPVESVDWLVYSRLSSDSITIHYTTPELASVTLPWISCPPPDITMVGPLDPPVELLDLRMPEAYWATLANISLDVATYPDLNLTGMEMPEAYWATLAGMQWIKSEPLPDLLLENMEMPEAYWATLANIVAPPLTPIQKIIATGPAHFWFSGVNRYNGVDLILNGSGDLVVNDSTAVKTWKAIVGGSEFTFAGTTPSARWEDGRIVPHVTGVGSAGMATFTSIADASIVVISKFTNSYLGNSLWEDTTTSSTNMAATSGSTNVVVVHGMYRAQTLINGDWHTYTWRVGAARAWQVIGSGNDAVNGPVGGAGAIARAGFNFFRPTEEIIAVIVYDDGERVGELLDEGLNGLIEELKNYTP